MDSMHRPNVNRRSGAIWLALIVVTALPGCHHGQGYWSCNDIVPGAIPQPNGTYDCQWIHAEKARADQDDFVIYQYEWSADGKQLTSSGQEHVACIGKRLDQVPFPVVIEPTTDEHVNWARKRAVLEGLTNCGVQIDADRVIVRRPEAEGLYGDEAAAIARNMFTTRGGGQGAGGGLGAGTSFGGTQGGLGTSTGIGVGMGSGMGFY
jgi:hypothetical protein